MIDLVQYGKKKLSQYESGGMREVITGKKKSLRLGLIGTGRHCRANLLPNLPFLPVELISVCAAHEENAKHYGKKYGALSFYNNFEQMLNDEQLDLIIASVNSDNHSKIITSALSRNLPVFVEKPVGPSLDIISPLLDLDNSEKVMVGFQKRFAPNYKWIKNAIEKKTYGKLHTVQMEFGVGSFTGGIKEFLLEVGIHFIDLMRFFIPNVEIENILIREIKNDQINCNLAFSTKQGIIGNLYLSSNFDWSNCHERVLVNFEKENIVVNNLVDFNSKTNSRSILSIPLEKVSKKRIVNENWHPNYISGDLENSSMQQAGFLPELKHFCNWVGGEGKNSISNLHNAYETHRLIEFILDKG